MADRIDELITNLGLPEVAAGLVTIMTGDTITEFTNTNPGEFLWHETIGIAASSIAGLAILGLAAEIKSRVRLSEDSKNT